MIEPAARMPRARRDGDAGDEAEAVVAEVSPRTKDKMAPWFKDGHLRGVGQEQAEALQARATAEQWASICCERGTRRATGPVRFHRAV